MEQLHVFWHFGILGIFVLSVKTLVYNREPYPSLSELSTISMLPPTCESLCAPRLPLQCPLQVRMHPLAEIMPE